MGYRSNMSSRFVPLSPGEPIGVVALSGPVDRERLEAGQRVLEGWGHPLVLAPNINAKSAYLAGDDGARVAGLEAVVAQGATLLLAARGGYGVTRLLPLLRLRELAAAGVRFVGYSDTSALLNAMVAAGGAPQVHGPMVAAGLQRRDNELRLRRLLAGELVGETLFRFDRGRVVRSGQASGPAIGGTLSVLAAMIGTPHEPRWDGSVLFIEEVGEPIYRLDRLLTQLRASARLRGVKALICGGLRHCGPVAERVSRWRELVAEAAAPEAPVVVDLPFGHGARNFAFPIGATVEVDTDSGAIRWSD
jgi:muramoyltetrapeptide carboxypeptidase